MQITIFTCVHEQSIITVLNTEIRCRLSSQYDSMMNRLLLRVDNDLNYRCMLDRSDDLRFISFFVEWCDQSSTLLPLKKRTNTEVFCGSVCDFLQFFIQ